MKREKISHNSFSTVNAVEGQNTGLGRAGLITSGSLSPRFSARD